MNLYNNTTYKLSNLIPIKPLRRKLRAHIAYKIEHPKVSKYLNENYIQPFLKGEIAPFIFKKSKILKMIKSYGNYGFKVKKMQVI